MEFPVDLPEKHQRLAAELHVQPEDIDEHFVKGGGPGGQKINKTNSCVELTHLPSKTTVRVQRYREQSANRLSAYKQLIMKVEEQVKGAKSERVQKAFKKRKQKQRRSRRSKEKILQEKHHRSAIKENRKPPQL